MCYLTHIQGLSYSLLLETLQMPTSRGPQHRCHLPGGCQWQARPGGTAVRYRIHNRKRYRDLYDWRHTREPFQDGGISCVTVDRDMCQSTLKHPMTSFEVVQYSIRVPLNLSKLIIQIEIRIVVIPSPDLLAAGRFRAIGDLVSTPLFLLESR